LARPSAFAGVGIGVPSRIAFAIWPAPYNAQLAIAASKPIPVHMFASQNGLIECSRKGGSTQQIFLLLAVKFWLYR
jgi:hypothetical protein